MKTAAVVGARSMLGGELVKRLHERGIATVTIGRSENDDIAFDLTDAAVSVPASINADVVFHCAASFAGDSDDGFRQNFAANAESAFAVAGLVRDLKATALIYAGSASSDRTLDPGNFTSYGLSKGIAEQLFDWALQRQKIRFCSLRFTQLFDVGGRCCDHQAWFGRIIAYASRGEDISMPRSDGVRNFLHVRDAADVMIRAAESQVAGVLDIAHPESLTIEQIADLAFNVFGQGGRSVIVPEKTPFRPIHFPDGADAFARLGLHPAIGMRDGIAMIRDAGTAPAFGPMDLT
ncbi:MAG TPA: NAD(P)-dependent oxidoreductase [Pararhizobium sp.]|uniref:NAD-dependent epimerase/dehydratase family protein n=1 Tax=Pararhizobium sp. TaxID=1977563 RepID=UPI002CD76CB3|nr:NAD(P)-dependent oxidoreductase [Pararhizobium sp.]HTO31751.1 NAD(P)-dependent oxidoreductase [Pararhizobium sp.]